MSQAIQTPVTAGNTEFPLKQYNHALCSGFSVEPEEASSQPEMAPIHIK